MNQSDALRVVAIVASYYRAELTDETALLWARDLLPYDKADAMEAVGVLQTFGKWLNWSDFVDAVKDCRKVRLQSQPQAALPGRGELRMATSPSDDIGDPVSYPIGGAMTIEEFLRARPDVRARVRKLGVWGELLNKAES